MKSISLAAVFLAALTVPAGLQAAVVLDAHYKPASTYFMSTVDNGPFWFTNIAQTFTIENTGKLVSFEVSLARGVNWATPSADASVAWEIRPLLASGAPAGAGTALASGTISQNLLASAPEMTWVSITGLNLDVTQGQKYALALSNTGTGVFSWGREQTNPYAGGEAWSDVGRTGNWALISNSTVHEQTFAIYVDAVPEPASVGILALAAGALLLRRR